MPLPGRRVKGDDAKLAVRIGIWPKGAGPASGRRTC